MVFKSELWATDMIYKQCINDILTIDAIYDIRYMIFMLYDNVEHEPETSRFLLKCEYNTVKYNCCQILFSGVVTKACP